MGIYDRDYNRAPSGGGMRGMGGGVRFAMPGITPVVKWLLIINTAIFFLNILLDPSSAAHPNGKVFIPLFGASPHITVAITQFWRVITYQFLHGNFGHLFWNMLWLYFFGSRLEPIWGSKRFLRFYLICGALGGIAYPILILCKFPTSAVPLIGASGSIFGLLAAVVFLFPRSRIYLMLIFPIPMPIFACIAVLRSVSSLIQGQNVGGELAHLVGIFAGAVLILWGPMMQRMRHKQSQGRWEKKIVEQRDFHREVDRILTKVHESGVSSLTRNEKKILQEATEREQQS